MTMNRRSLSHSGRKSPDCLKNQIDISNTSKGHRKRSTNSISGTAFNSSTIFTCCALAALVCFTVQSRLFLKTFDDRKPHNQPDVSLPPLPPENAKQTKPRSKSQQPSDTPRGEIGNNDHTMKTEETGGESFNAATPIPKRSFPPRVVRFEVLHDDSLSLKHNTPDALQLEEIAKNSISETGSPVTDIDTSRAAETDNSDPSVSGNITVPDVDDPTTAVEDKGAVQDHHQSFDDGKLEECVPMAKWQTSVPVNCNSIHEIDIASSIVNQAGRGNNNKRFFAVQNNITLPDEHIHHHEPFRHPSWNESQLKFLGQGWFRGAWRLDRQYPQGPKEKKTKDNEEDDAGDTIILKMLRPERDFTAEFYELHRIDAVAMEQLTHSQFVLNVYGYCGQSALNEFANFRIAELSSLEKFDRQLRGKVNPTVNRMKLKLGVSVATGLAHVHELPADLVGDDRPTMAHYDLNPRNVAIVKGGMPKLNDFNVAHFLRWNPRTNTSCGFESRLHEPWWRAPEEVSLTERAPLTEAVDVYSLGNLLFHILTTHSPRGKMKKERMESVRQDVLQGTPPSLPKEFATSKDPATVAMRQAMDMCFAKAPMDRATASEVANFLLEAYMRIVESERNKNHRHGKK